MNNSKFSGKEQNYRIFEATHEMDHEWCDFISIMSASTVYHHPAWLNVLEDETNQKVIRLICKDEKEKIVGVYPLQYTRGLPFGLGGTLAARRLSSLPRTPIGGPVAVNKTVEAMLVEKAIEISRQSNVNRLIQIKSYDPTLNEKIPSLYKYFWRDIYITKIPHSMEEIRFGDSKNHSAIKRAVNKAIRSGITVRYTDSDVDLIKWYDLYAETMQFHAVPSRSINFFRGLFKYLRPLGLAQLLIAEAEKGSETEIIAGIILLRYNKTMIYEFGGSKRDTLDMRSNDLLHWTAIHDAQAEGFEYYDMGEVAEDHSGLTSYKKKWTSEKHPLYHFYSPKPDMHDEKRIGERNVIGMKRKIWNILPRKVTTIIGANVNKWL